MHSIRRFRRFQLERGPVRRKKSVPAQFRHYWPPANPSRASSRRCAKREPLPKTINPSRNARREGLKLMLWK